jgi:hypothetical protein
MGRDHSEDLCVDWNVSYGNRVDDVEWIYMAQDREQWRPL